MGRVRGRFYTNRFERTRMNRDMRQYQQGHGTYVTWFYLSGTTQDSIYDEPSVMGGRSFTQSAKAMPVLSAVPMEGANAPGDAGRYVTNRVALRVSLRQVMNAGMPDLSRDYERHYGDRFLYRGLVYDVQAIIAEGNIDATDTDIVLRIEGNQLRPDELTSDPDFAPYAGLLPDWTDGYVTVAGGPVSEPPYDSPWHGAQDGAWYDPAAPATDPDVALRVDDDGNPYLEV